MNFVRFEKIYNLFHCYYLSFEVAAVIYIFKNVKADEKFWEKAKTNFYLLLSYVIIFSSVLFKFFTLGPNGGLDFYFIEFIIFNSVILVMLGLNTFPNFYKNLFGLHLYEHHRYWGLKFVPIDGFGRSIAIALLIFQLYLLIMGVMGVYEDLSIEPLYIHVSITICIFPIQLHFWTSQIYFEIDYEIRELRIIKTSWLRRLFFQTQHWNLPFEIIRQLRFHHKEIFITIDSSDNNPYIKIKFTYDPDFSAENAQAFDLKLQGISKVDKRIQFR